MHAITFPALESTLYTSLLSLCVKKEETIKKPSIIL